MVWSGEPFRGNECCRSGKFGLAARLFLAFFFFSWRWFFVYALGELGFDVFVYRLFQLFWRLLTDVQITWIDPGIEDYRVVLVGA